MCEVVNIQTLKLFINLIIINITNTIKEEANYLWW